MKRILFSVAVLTLFAGCDLSSVDPTLASGLSRISVDKVTECAKLQGSEARAGCIGTEVGSAALDTAIDKAAELAELAKEAADADSTLSDREKRAIAGALNYAMLALEAEIARQ